MYICQFTHPLTSAPFTHVYTSHIWGGKVCQEPYLSTHTSHDHSLIYSHLPHPLIDGNHLISAAAVQGLLTCPIGTSSLNHAVFALQLKSPGLGTIILERKEILSVTLQLRYYFRKKGRKCKEASGEWCKGERLYVCMVWMIYLCSWTLNNYLTHTHIDHLYSISVRRRRKNGNDMWLMPWSIGTAQGKSSARSYL